MVFMKVTEENSKPILALIGNGMVSCRFCEEFVNLKLNDIYDLVVIGEEEKPAYDRVQLTKYAADRSFDKILLKNSRWYKENNIKLLLGKAVESVNTEQKTLLIKDGENIKYNKLVFATGSAPYVPPVPGNDSPGVFVYRTYKDVDKISDFAEGCRVAAVVGGGLLGLEAANFLKNLGLRTHIIEQAEYLMPRQLDISGSQLLMNKIKNKGYQLHTGVSLEEIKKLENNSLDICFKDGEKISVDIVIFAAGVRANSDLALNAGISCSQSKGIVVNDCLETSVKDIYAIGECVRHKGQLYGLVAPGYEMAGILARRISGKDDLFVEADMSTRLKMLGEDVISLGDALQPYKSIIYRNEDTYRKIVHFENTIVGAIGVGEWLQSGQIQTAIQNKMPLNIKEIRNFIKTGSLWDNERLDVRKWPDDTLICNCMKISKGTILEKINEGKNTPLLIKACTGASSVCGSCEPLVSTLCGQNVEPRNKPEKTLLVFSFLTLSAVLVLLFSTPFWGGNSVESFKYKATAFLTSSSIRQISGFTILGLTVLAAALSLRKRMKKFQFGSFKAWRLTHALIGFLSVIILILHTGFSAGRNINFILFTTFSIINLFGFITGFASAFEFFGMNKLSAFCRKWKPQITFIHMLAFWPLPVLLVFHIIQAYYFG